MEVRGAAMFRKGQALGSLQDVRGAMQCFSEVRRMAQQTSSVHLRMQVLREEGYAARSLRTGKRKMEESCRLAERLEDQQSLAVCISGLAVIQNRLGNIAASLNHFREAERIDETFGNDRGRVYNLNGAAVGYRNLHQYAEASTAWQTALALAENLNMKPMIMKILCNLQNLYALNLADIAAAQQWRRRCVESLQALGREPWGPECPICLQNLDNGEKVFVDPKCYHASHFECLPDGAGQRGPCPLCRV
ncbi:unnamed protein product [Durusdinium trenchii]